MDNYLRGIKLREAVPPTSYLADIPAIRYLASVPQLSFHKPVTFLVGENGTGKSTILEAIAIAMGFNAEGGSWDFTFSTTPTHSELHEYITTIKTVRPKDGFFLRAESFYNAASYLENTSTLQRYGGVSFHKQSHGESFLSLIAYRFGGEGLYLLDEPEAALSPQRLMSLIVAIDDLVERDSQFIIATHSPILMAYPNSEILQFSDFGIQKVAYQDTENYQITKQFLNKPEQMIRYLLKK
ncbi:MAG: AAA family ATPase [Firmicutes bacterium]|nr:AAA family ATPase [Bacillota bacterium]